MMTYKLWCGMSCPIPEYTCSSRAWAHVTWDFLTPELALQYADHPRLKHLYDAMRTDRLFELLVLPRTEVPENFLKEDDTYLPQQYCVVGYTGDNNQDFILRLAERDVEDVIQQG